jgi:hypothetical protein
MATESERLPYVDEHAEIVAATPERTWEALLRVAEGATSGAGASRFAGLVGCADTAASGPRPLAVGSAFPGFHVAAAEPAAELALAGSHRFSEYALVFRLDRLDGGRTRVRAETRAEFPGLHGSVYRTLVIGTRMHVLVTRRLLGATKRNAERA